MGDIKKILLVEPEGNFIRLDRCMQSIESWGGVYRFPLNLARIAAHLLSLGHVVEFIDLQADKSADLPNKLNRFQPDLCILSSGFPSMWHDSATALKIKSINPNLHISTFGVPPTLLESDFFAFDTWGFQIPFDSIVIGGEPAFAYEKLLDELSGTGIILEGHMRKTKDIGTVSARHLFNIQLYRSPFTGDPATYIEGTYGCPYRCSFCVVPELYGGHFSKRSAQDIIQEFKYVLEVENVKHITLWDEGTTFQKSFLEELCEGLIELRNGSDKQYHDFVWTTRSTTALLDKPMVDKLGASGLSGITLGIESFDPVILQSIEKEISVASNKKAIKCLNDAGIISIGHIILGHTMDNKRSVENTLNHTFSSGLNFAQFYCAVPYPGTKLHKVAQANDLIRVDDLTKYELCNPIMDTTGGLSYLQIGEYREQALKKFWTSKRFDEFTMLIAKHPSKPAKIANPKNAWRSKILDGVYEAVS